MTVRLRHVGWLALVCGAPVLAQDWNPGKVYDAGALGSPSSRRYTDDNGTNFPGWRINDSQGIVTNDPPSARPGGIAGREGNFIRITSDPGDGKTGAKEKHLTNKTGLPYQWTFNGTASTRTALFWRVYLPSSPSIDKFPSIQIRTHNRRHHLDFHPNAVQGCDVPGAPPRSGWVDAEDVTIDSGGVARPSGGRYLPMSMDAWHTIRVEVFANGHFEAWIDEDEGLSDVRHISATANKTGSGEYIEIGRRSSEQEATANTQYWTNYLAWGQEVEGGANEIKPVAAGTPELCANGMDDDGDGLADCADPACDCELVSETSSAACSDGVDDDGDGLIDCADPDCAAVSFCAEDAAQYVLTMIRQVGNWQSSTTAQIYCSVYDEEGNPLNGVVLRDPYNCIDITTSDPDGPFDQQGGHGRLSSVPNNSLGSKVYQFYVVNDQGAGAVNSEITPAMHAELPRPNGGPSGIYSWQFEFMRKSRADTPITFNADQPTYKFDAVEMNTPPNPNDTLDQDLSNLPPDGGRIMGQTFVATGNRLVSARAEVTNGFTNLLQYRLSIHGPVTSTPPATLADIGPELASGVGPANMIESEWWKQMIVWPLTGAGAVELEVGEIYFLKVVRVDTGGVGYPDFNSFGTTSDYYAGGQRFVSRDGVTLTTDPGFHDLVAYVVAGNVGEIDECALLRPIVFDANDDSYVDQQDFLAFQDCATGPAPAPSVFEALSQTCRCMDVNKDQAVDQEDFGLFQRCFSGSLQPADPGCD
ncbi:MAG: hypothetical protein AMXMBFR13_35790 [Phycisphaerae bacterium]